MRSGAHALAEARNLARAVHPVSGESADYDGLLDAIGERRLVLIGEASHGTHEFYAERARLTRRLVEERGVTAVAVEADWPDAARVNRYVLGLSDDPGADEALSDFLRFPTWMWRNRVVLEFVRWLRVHNDRQADPARKVRFHGLDLYSLRASMEAVVTYLDAVDPAEAAAARRRYACFDHVGAEGQAYGYALAHAGAVPCEREVVAQLMALQQRAPEYAARDGWVAEDEFFAAEQNAVVVRDAEEYYQQMYAAGESSWNLRDTHMADTLDALVAHLGRRAPRPPKIAVWEHNSHVGDARATTRSARGHLTLGQLVRQRHATEAFLIGMTTYDGQVTAAPDWGRPAHRWNVRPALAGSHEEYLHAVGVPRFWLATAEPRACDALSELRLERAIGVVYRPRHERQSHYYLARLAEQYDAVLHLDRTQALEPLERTVAWQEGEPPETYPSGL
jgi:erythromycin esterase-like protein